MSEAIAQVEWSEVLPWLVAALLGLDKAIVAIRHLLDVPGEIERGIVERAERDQALARLAVLEPKLSELERKADEILTQLRPNGGMSLWDQVRGARKELRDHVEDSQRVHRELFRVLDETPPGGNQA